MYQTPRGKASAEFAAGSGPDETGVKNVEIRAGTLSEAKRLVRIWTLASRLANGRNAPVSVQQLRNGFDRK